MVLDRQVVRLALDIEQQVLPLTARGDLLGRDGGETDFVGVAEVDIFNDINAPVTADEIGVLADPAFVDLVAASGVDEIDAGRADHFGRGGVMVAQQRLVQRHRIHHGAQIEVDADILERRDEVLQDEFLIEVNRRAKDVAGAVDLIVRIDLNEDFGPLHKIVVGRIEPSRRVGEDRLVNRRKLAILIGVVDVQRVVVGDPLEVVGKPALHRHLHREGAADDHVLVHDRVKQFDHRLDAGDVFAVLQTRSPGLVHRIVDDAGGLVDIGGQHRRLEIDADQRGGEMELAGGQQLHPIGGIVSRSDLIQRFEIDLVIAEVEVARRAELVLQLK